MNIKNIYQKIANENDVTLEEVEREIQEAIAYSYKNPLQEGSASNAEIPSVEEFIQFVLQEVEQERG